MGEGLGQAVALRALEGEDQTLGPGAGQKEEGR